MNSVKDKLRLLRLSHKYTQKDLAEKLDIHVTTYGKIELGEIGIDIYKARKLAKLYGISIDDFFEEEANYAINTVQEPKPTFKKARKKPIRIYLEIDPDADEKQLNQFLKGLRGILEEN